MQVNSLNVDGPGSDMDKRRTDPKEGASYITLDPFTTPSTKKKQKYTRKALNFEDLFGPQKWTKYFEIERSHLRDDFKLYDKLAVKVGSDVLFRHQKDGHCIIEAATEEQSEKLQELVQAGDPSLPVKKNETLNVCHGTVVVPNNVETGDTDFSECSEKVKHNIRIQGYEVKNVSTYIRPARGNRKYPLRVAKITFEGRVLPDVIVIAGQRLSVREYIPTPQQCTKCWKYGHGSKYCKLDVHVCPICGTKGHQKSSCSSKANSVCINCHQNHPAFSKACVQYKREQMNVKLRFTEGLSYKAAVNKLRQTGNISSLNYRKALENKNAPTASTPKVSKLDTGNRFSALQIEDSQNQFLPQNISPKSPKQKSKRNRESSSEETLSPKLNPKQRPKMRSENKEMHKITAEIHVNEDLSMDETVIFAQNDHENLDKEKTEAPLPSEDSLPIVKLSESSVSTAEASESSITTVIPSKLPESALPTAASPPSVTTLPAASMPPSTSVLPAAAEQLLVSDLLPVSSTVAPSEASLTSTASSEASLPTVAPLKSPSLPAVPSTSSSQSTILSETPSLPAAKVVPKTGTKDKSGTDKTKTKIKKPEAIKNVELRIHQKESKIPKKISSTGAILNKPRNLLRDYHMPPGYNISK